MEHIYLAAIDRVWVCSMLQQVLYHVYVPEERGKMECRKAVVAFRLGVYPLFEVCFVVLGVEESLSVAMFVDMIA